MRNVFGFRYRLRLPTIIIHRIIGTIRTRNPRYISRPCIVLKKKKKVILHFIFFSVPSFYIIYQRCEPYYPVYRSISRSRQIYFTEYIRIFILHRYCPNTFGVSKNRSWQRSKPVLCPPLSSNGVKSGKICPG